MLKEGQATRRRAQERQGTGRPGFMAWYPELEAFRERGWKTQWIADAVGLSERQVRRILFQGRHVVSELRNLPIEQQRTQATERMMEFTPGAFEEFFNTFSGKKLPRHAKEWVKDFIENRNLVLNVPPRHAKTTIMAIWLTCWLIARNRNEQILIVSKTDTFAQNISRSIAYILEANELLIHTFGRFAPQQQGDTVWAPGRGMLMVVGRSKQSKPGDLSVQSRGMNQQILGMEATVVICDDITDPQVARSPAQRDEESRKFRNDILTRIEPESVGGASGRALVIGQRVDMEDIYGELKDQTWPMGPKKGQSLWTVIEMPAVLDWAGMENEDPSCLLWPERFGWQEVFIEYARFGDVAFETMFQQRPRPGGSVAIKPEWIERCKDPDRGVGMGLQTDDPNVLIPTARVLSIDPSPTEWNAAIVADVARIEGDWACFPVHIRRWKGRGPEFEQNLEEMLDRFKVDYLIVESSTFFRWITDSVWFETLRKRVKIIEHHTGVNKNDMELGADSLAVDFEMGRIRLPWGSPEARDQSQLLITEALNWPLSKTYDVFMALWFIKWNRKKLRPKNPNALRNTFFGKKVEPNASGRKMLAEKAKPRRSSFFERVG